jgi:hypothetical protein
VFLLHRYKPHTHAHSGFAPLDDGARTHLSRRYVKQQLYRSAGRRRVHGLNIQPAQPKIGNVRYASHVGPLPGQNRTFGGGNTRMATKVVHARHAPRQNNGSRGDEPSCRYGPAGQSGEHLALCSGESVRSNGVTATAIRLDLKNGEAPQYYEAHYAKSSSSEKARKRIELKAPYSGSKIRAASILLRPNFFAANCLRSK